MLGLFRKKRKKVKHKPSELAIKIGDTMQEVDRWEVGNFGIHPGMCSITDTVTGERLVMDNGGISCKGTIHARGLSYHDAEFLYERFYEGLGKQVASGDERNRERLAEMYCKERE